MSLSYNGVSVVSNESIPNPVQNNPTLFVQVGLNYLQPPAQAMMIYYDNILLEAP